MTKTAPKTGPKTLDDLLELIEKSGLYTESQLAEARALVADCGDSDRALECLVAADRLTAWQADQLRAGQFVLKLGDYQLLQENETWDFGRAFLAAHGSNGQRVSLKLLSSKYPQDEQLWKEFVGDLRKLARVNHPHLAPFRDLAKAGGRQFLVGELEDTPTIEQRLATWGTAGTVAQARLLMQAADALHNLHQRDLAHGCLTGRRIRVTEDGSLRIYDVGLERLLKRPSEASSTAAPLSPPADWPYNDRPILRDLYALGMLIEKLRIEAAIHRQPPSWWTKDASSEAGEALQQLCRRMQGKEGEPPQDAAQVLAACNEWAKRYAVETPKQTNTAEGAITTNGRAAAEGVSVKAAAQDTSGIVINTERRRKRRPKPEQVDAPAPPKRGKFLIVCSSIAVFVIFVLAMIGYLNSRAKQRAIATAQKKDSTTANVKQVAVQGEKDVLETNPVIDETTNTDESNQTKGPTSPEIVNAIANSIGVPPASLPAADSAASDPTTNPNGTNGAADQTAASTTNEAPGSASATTPTNTTNVPANNPPSPPTPTVPTPPTDSSATQPTPPATDAAAQNTTPAGPPMAEDPYRELPKAVALPERESAAGAEASVLATVHVDDKIPCFLALLGGDRVGKSPLALKMENAAGGTMERMWDVFAVEGPTNRTVIAQFGLQGGQLSFHWLEKAKDLTLAGMLENCLLQITINEQKAVVALRQPLMVKPLVLDLDRGTVSGKWQIPNLPDPANCRFEVLELEGPFPTHALFPPDSVSAAKGEQWILLGEPKAEQVLTLHVESTMKRVHQVTITALSQHGDDPDASWLKDKTRRMVKSQRNQNLKDLQAEMLRLAAVGKQFEGADETKLTETDKQTRNAAKVRLERDTTLATQLQKLEELCKVLNDVGKVHFHVVYEVEGHPIELLHTAKE